MKDKISFLDSADFLCMSKNILSEDEYNEVEQIISSIESVSDDVEYSYSAAGGSLMVRCFDYGRYYFIFPFALSPDADLAQAILLIVRYCVLEEIEPVIRDVFREDIGIFFSLGYRHLDIDAETADSLSYRVKIKTECALLDDIPEITADGISLSPLNNSDAQAYYFLLTDKQTNEFFGYDVLDDYEDFTPDFLIENARGEFDASVSVTLAIRLEGKFIGEFVYYGFDGRGGAEITLRILPDFRRRGYARETLFLAAELAKGIGLTKLFATVKQENLPSVALFDGAFDRICVDGDVIHYSISLYPECEQEEE